MLPLKLNSCEFQVYSSHGSICQKENQQTEGPNSKDVIKVALSLKCS